VDLGKNSVIHLSVSSNEGELAAGGVAAGFMGLACALMDGTMLTSSIIAASTLMLNDLLNRMTAASTSSQM
jgi:hypothetical protein